MRKRRRTRGTWLPTLGTLSKLEDPNERVSGIDFFINTTNTVDGGEDNTGLIPLTYDLPKESKEASPLIDSLSDFAGSAYLLRRIVGKIHLHREVDQAASNEDQGMSVLVGVGFLVARANDLASGGSGPIGSATPAERRDNYSVLNGNTVREPWIWRRTWILGRSVWPPQLVTMDARASEFPPSTAHYGSVLDGGHIDAKTKRIVSSDNRLWMAISVLPYPFRQTTGQQEQTRIRGYLDYRLFASLRRDRNTGAF